MKKIILSIFACAALLFSSCDQDNVAAILDSNTPYASVVQPSMSVLLEESFDGKFKVEVARSVKTGQTATDFRILSVVENGVNITSKNYFTLASSQASFVEGSGYGTVELVYDLNNLDPRFTYAVTIQNAGETDSPTHKKGVISAKRKVAYKQFAQGTVYSNWGIFDPILNDWVSEARVNVEKADGVEFYRVLNFWGPGTQVEFYVESNNDVIIPKQLNGEVSAQYGNISVNSATPAGKRTDNVFVLRTAFTVAAGSFGTFPETLVID